MQRGPNIAAVAALATVALLLQCRTAPTTILLRIEAEVGLPQPEELRLAVFGGGGIEVKDRRLPETGRLMLPGDVVLYPRQAGQLRLHVRALAFGQQVGDGAVSVEAKAGQQESATVVLRGGALADRDGDGVPDVIDSCPDIPNPEQRPCQPDGQVADARPDRPTDILADRLSPDVLDCDKDGDSYRSLACGGNDCDDTHPKINPGQTEGPPGDASCTDGLDNDCDRGKDLADTNCHSCTSSGECDDGNVCTADSCMDGVCKNAAANDGLVCDDGNACTTSTVCKTGLCGAGQPLSCAGDVCKVASCDPKSGCTSQNAPNGTKCDDGKFCFEGETCTAGVCGGGTPRDCSATAPPCKVGSCNESSASCVYTPASGSLTCDDGDPCTQGEKCSSGGVCTPPPMLVDTVDNQAINNGTDRSARVDSSGAVHFAYHAMGDHALRYATNASGTWVSEQVDTGSPNIGDYPALALDAQGQVHVAYLDAGRSQIRHAVKGTGGWQSESIEGGASVFGYTSIAIDGAGIHVSYKRYDDLYYALKTATGWSKTTVDVATAEDVGFDSSLAVDAAGKVHIAHTRGTYASTGGVDYVIVKALRYSTNSSGTWTTIEPAVLAGVHGGAPSLALGSGGQVYITHTTNTFFQTSGGTLYLTSRVAGLWTTETVGTPAEAGTFSSILLDSGGKLHVAYRRPAATVVGAELRYATNASGSWVLKPIETIGGTNGYPSIAQAPGGTMHVVFKNGVQGAVRHAAFSACP